MKSNPESAKKSIGLDKEAVVPMAVLPAFSISLTLFILNL
jgi:hypothetical protein